MKAQQIGQIMIGIGCCIAAFLEIVKRDKHQKADQLRRKTYSIIAYHYIKGILMFLLGVLVIAMGVIEVLKILPSDLYVAIYISAAAILLLLLILNNYRYFGKLRP
jgi:uncharacterized membrane protein